MSEQVKRYEWDYGIECMVVSKHGEYVSYDDYATLQAECERLRAAEAKRQRKSEKLKQVSK